MPSADSYSALGAKSAGPVRRARVEIGQRVLADTAGALDLRARLASQVNAGDGAGDASDAEVLRRASEILERELS